MNHQNEHHQVDILAAVASLPCSRGVFSARARVSPVPAGALRLEATDDRLLANWLAADVADVAGADDKLATAHLLGSLSFSMAEILGGLALRGLTPAITTPEAVAITTRRERWQEGGESGEAQAYDLVFLDGRLVQVADPALTLDACLRVLLTPLVVTLHNYSSLSQGALWRIVGDSLSAALLAQGKETGKEDPAMAIATTILHNQQSPLYSRQTQFMQILLPEQPEVTEWFRIRGGCCRHYTSDGGDYCTTCVLRDDTSRTARLRDYLRRKHGVVPT